MYVMNPDINCQEPSKPEEKGESSYCVTGRRAKERTVSRPTKNTLWDLRGKDVKTTEHHLRGSAVEQPIFGSEYLSHAVER